MRITWGLEAARTHLDALNAPVPDNLPPFGESVHDPPPEAEIDPRDEFGIDLDDPDWLDKILRGEG